MMIKTISNLGVSSEIKKEMISKVRFANISSAYLAIACSISAPFYYLMGLPELALFLVPATIGYFSVPLFNAAGFHAMARSVLLAVFTLGAFYYASRLGSDYKIHYLLITGLVGVQVLFLAAEPKWRNTLSLGTFLLWIIYETKVFNPIPYDSTAAHTDPSLPLMMVISVGIIVFGSIILVFFYMRHEGNQLKEALHIAENDSLTQLGTQFLLRSHNDLRNPGTDFKLIIIQIHGLRQINSDYGWDFGNEALKFFAKATQQSFPDHCKFFRLNPALFAVWSPSELINPRLEDSLHFLNHEVESSPYPQLKFSIGTASTLQFNNTSDLVTAAQKKLIKYVRPSF